MSLDKRFLHAFKSLHDLDNENTLFNLFPIIDSTSKLYFPLVKSTGKRFMLYIDDILQDIFFISTGGIKVTGLDSFPDGKGGIIKISRMLYNVRNAQTHEPGEVSDVADLSDSPLGIGHDLFGIDFTHALFLLLLSDEKNKDRLKADLFSPGTYGFSPKGQYKLNNVIGNRKRIIEIFDRFK